MIDYDLRTLDEIVRMMSIQAVKYQQIFWMLKEW